MLLKNENFTNKLKFHPKIKIYPKTKISLLSPTKGPSIICSHYTSTTLTLHSLSCKMAEFYLRTIYLYYLLYTYPTLSLSHSYTIHTQLTLHLHYTYITLTLQATLWEENQPTKSRQSKLSDQARSGLDQTGGGCLDWTPLKPNPVYKS